MKKVLINVGVSAPPVDGSYVSGIGKSIYWLMEAINKLPKNQIPFEIELYASGSKSLKYDYYNWSYKHHTIPFPQTIEVGRKQNLPSLYRNFFLKYDIFHITDNVDYAFPNEPVVATIHDLDAYLKSTNTQYKLWCETIARQCKRIACCSEYTKKDVIEHLGVDSKKIDVIYWGCDQNTFKVLSTNIIQKTLNKYRISRPYFFACSCSNPRKNIVTALNAYRKFMTGNPRHIFILVWSNPPQVILDEFALEIQSGRIVFLPHVSDDDLVALYNGSSMSIYVTRREGFGFPILESFACETPVMTCRNTCLEEIGQDAAIYVGEDNEDEMVAVMRLFEDATFNKTQFVEKSHKVLSKFSWEKCAKEYVEFYKRALDN